MKKILYAGVDGAICKIEMIAKHRGIISKRYLGLDIIVKENNEKIVNEIKRIGYLKDRETPI